MGVLSGHSASHRAEAGRVAQVVARGIAKGGCTFGGKLAWGNRGRDTLPLQNIIQDGCEG